MNIRERMASAIHRSWCGQDDSCTRANPNDRMYTDAALTVLDDPDVIEAIAQAYNDADMACDDITCEGQCGARAVVALLQSRQP